MRLLFLSERARVGRPPTCRRPGAASGPVAARPLLKPRPSWRSLLLAASPRPPRRSYCLLLLRAALRSYSLHAAKGTKVTLQFDEFYQVRFNHERHEGMKRCVASQRHPVPLREAPPRPGALAAADLLLLPRRCLFLDFHRNRGKQCGISCARRLPLNRVFVRTPPRCCDLGSSVSS